VHQLLNKAGEENMAQKSSKNAWQKEFLGLRTSALPLGKYAAQRGSLTKWWVE
jgi:hypothetical protein